VGNVCADGFKFPKGVIEGISARAIGGYVKTVSASLQELVKLEKGLKALSALKESVSATISTIRITIRVAIKRYCFSEK